jgi:hypothetical protein
LCRSYGRLRIIKIQKSSCFGCNFCHIRRDTSGASCYGNDWERNYRRRTQLHGNSNRANFLKPKYLEVIKESLGGSTALKHALLCYLEGVCPVEVSRQHSREIGLIESKVDKMEWDITKKIFSSDLSYSHKIHLRLCLESIVNVSDLAEDAADRLELVTLKSMV